MQKKRGTKDVQESTRLKVCAYLKNQFGTQGEAALIFGINIKSVNRIWCHDQMKGKRGLQSKKRGVKGGKQSNGEQAAEDRR